MSPRLRYAVAPALLVACLVLALLRSWAGTRLDSYTIDEPWHAVAGAAYERTGDFSLNPEHPPLVKRWAARWLGEGFHLPAVPVLSEKTHEREFVEDAMYLHNDAGAARARTRAAMWTFHLLLLAAVGALAWRTLGLPWAVGTVAFFAIEPTVAAHLPLVMTDLPVALSLLLSSLALGALMGTWRWRWAAAAGVAMGLALGSKHSALPGLAALAAFSLVAWAWQSRSADARTRARRLAQLAMSAVLAVALLWLQYDARFAPRADGGDAFNRPFAAKLDDLRSLPAKTAIGFAQAHRLLPQAYLWGLADTVRVGIEGRGEPGGLYWGRFVEGAPPWHAWPSLIAAKVPLALLAMAVLGLFALWRLPLEPTARWTLAAVLAMATGHAASLLGSGSAYGGVRHALPLVAALAVLAGAWVRRAWHAKRPAARFAAVLPLAIALAMTAREPRLWEYHNELAGGTEGAWQAFDNEGLDIGQRQHEILAFGEREIAPTGLPLYRSYFGSDAQSRRAPFPYRRRVESLHDDNVQGIYEGYFLLSVGARLPAPQFSYDPAEMLAGLEPVVRLGNAEIWRGRQVQPKSRLGALYGRIVKYVYSDGGSDWRLVAARAQEIVDAFPQHAPAAIELGNAWLRLGDRAQARRAYAVPLGQTVLAIEPALRRALEQQVARLDTATALAAIAPLRNPAME